MDKPWLNNYPDSVPAEIDLSQYNSILDMADEALEKHKDRIAYMNFGKELTFAEWARTSRDFAAYLQHLGLKKGDRIAIMLPNILQYPIAILGALRAGLTVVNTNPMYTARELRHQLEDSGAKAIVVIENFAHILEQVRDDVPVEHVITTRVGGLLGFPKGSLINFVLKYVKKGVPPFNLPGSIRFDKALKEGSRHQLLKVESSMDDIAFLQYTGGTTGVAKGAMLTHRNMVANTMQAMAWIGSADLGQDVEYVVSALPMYHIFALTANCFAFMAMGGCNVLITNPRDVEGFIKELGTFPFSFFPGVNTLFNSLLATPSFAELDFSHLKAALGGGMAVQRAVAERWQEVTGSRLIEAYGLTETSPAACINPMDMEGFNGCIGLPISSTEGGIMDDDGNLLPQGERGELVIRGPQVMKGYWQRPEETAKVITDDGWLRTGDVALMNEDGYFKIVDRKKDMILVSGFNVFPNEIEDVVAHHPKVLEVAVIGIPDAKSTEAVKMFVAKSDPSLTEEELRAFCKEQLTGYKRPRHIEFRDELPKSNVGKILRRELRDEELAKQ